MTCRYNMVLLRTTDR